MLLLIVCVSVFFSCNQQDEMFDNKIESTAIETDSREFKLISSKVVLPEDSTIELRSGNDVSFFESYYERSKQTHTYYYHNGNRSDHYYGQESGSSIRINGINYPYDWQRFQHFDYNLYELSLPLFRYYSALKNDHKLVTEYNGYDMSSDYNYDTRVGFIFEKQYAGTSPLMEYYSDLYMDSFYTLNDVIDPGSYRYMGTIGYVYPGKLIQANKVPFSFKINVRNNNCPGAKMTFYIKTRERDTYYVREYAFEFNSSGNGTITLPHTHALVNATVVVSYNSSNPNVQPEVIQRIIEPGTGPDNYYGYIAQYQRRQNGFETIFDFILINRG